MATFDRIIVLLYSCIALEWTESLRVFTDFAKQTKLRSVSEQYPPHMIRYCPDGRHLRHVWIQVLSC